MARGGGRGGGSFGGGGRGGGSFGGGRGGGRSFGGSRGGGRRVGGGSSRSRGGGRPTSSGRRTTGGSGGGYRRPGGFWGPRPFFGGWGGYGGYGGYGYGRRRYGRGGCGGCGAGGCGCLPSILLIIVILFIFNFAWSAVPGTNNNTAIETVRINPSTRNREPLEAGLVNETEYYQDTIGDWINDPVELEDGLRHFYNETNIQPFVYITDNVDGDPNPSPDEIDAFAGSLYDELFTDEAHLLLVHFENYAMYEHDFSYHLVTGTQAKVLMDTEAENILFDNLDHYYHSDVTEDQLFSEAFRDTADRIMTVTRSPWIPVLIVVGVAVILIVLFNWWRSALNKPEGENKEANGQKDKEDKEQFDDFDF